jgi:hypothetical protein
MAQVTSYSQLLAFVLSRVPGADSNIVNFLLKELGRRFCQRTEAFRDDLDPLAIVDYQQDYALTNPYTAAIHRLLTVKVNSIEQPPDRYSLYLERKLRWRSNAVPHDQSDRLLTCGTVGATAIATWQAVTAGAFTIGLGSDDYTVEDLDFSGCADLDAVALAIQTGLRVELESNTGFCRYNDTTAGSEHFQFWLEGSGTIDYLAAPASGTNISGAGFLNGLTGTGALSALLEVAVVFRPDVLTDILPDWFLDRYGMQIAHGAIAELAAQPGKPYSDRQLAIDAMAQYEQGVADACYDNRQEHKDDDIRIGA